MADEARPAPPPSAKDDAASPAEETREQPQCLDPHQAHDSPQGQDPPQDEGSAGDHADQQPAADAPKPISAINIMVRDGVQNVLHFKIKSTTALKKVMDAFCERIGTDRRSRRFLFQGQPIAEDDTPEKVSEQCDISRQFRLMDEIARTRKRRRN
jgi:Ubiquitin-2 like Rad60 SUMO-like